MVDSCPICAEDLPLAKTVLSCGHEFCSQCILDNVALNTGSVEGTSRDKCPLCRVKICKDVLPSTTHQIRLDDLNNEVYSLRGQLLEQDESVRKLTNKLEEQRNQYLHLMTQYNRKSESHEFAKFRAHVRKNTLKRFQIDVQTINEMVFRYTMKGVHSESDLENIMTKVRYTLIPPVLTSEQHMEDVQELD